LLESAGKGSSSRRARTPQGVLDPAVARHEIQQRLQLHIGKRVFGRAETTGIRRTKRRRLQDADDPLALGRRAALQREDQRQRHLAFAHVRVGALAEVLGVGGIVECIVPELERQAHLAPEVDDAAPLGARHAAEDRTRVARRREQHCALAVDDLEVVALGDLGIEALLHLQDFALGHAPDGVGEHPEDVEVSVLDDHRRGPGEQEVAHEHGPAIAPDDVRGGAAAARRCEVDHVIMQQRGGVKQLDRRRDVHPARAGIAAELRSEDQQGGPHTLAPGTKHVLANQLHDLALRAQLVMHRPLDLLERVFDARQGNEERRSRRGARHRARG
jgi:hypothetical protein